RTGEVAPKAPSRAVRPRTRKGTAPRRTGQVRAEMLNRRTWLAAALVVLALIVHVAVVARLPFPGGVSPDIVLLVVAALALVTGPCAGLAADIVPPAYHTIGRYGLVCCLVGYVVGLARDEAEDVPWLRSLIVAAGAVGGLALYIMVGAVLGDARVTWEAVV